MRPDLLALTPEDLMALANRGVVKRAVRDAGQDPPLCTWTESADGLVHAAWPEGVMVRMPPGERLRAHHCNCGAAELCRHIVTSVLVYQKQAASQVALAWDPGAIADEILRPHFTPSLWGALKRQFQQSQVFELERGEKPTARFAREGRYLRFLVPGDPVYTHCDCNAPPPCRHVPLAVWAFRLLAPEERVGRVAIEAQVEAEGEGELLDGIERAIGEAVLCGWANTPPALTATWRRLEHECRASDLIWPAELITEILRAVELKQQNDARFQPVDAMQLLAELLVRTDAIRTNTGAAPAFFVRGSKADRPNDIRSGVMTGLGSDVTVKKGLTIVNVYLYDSGSNAVVAVRREFLTDREDFRTLGRNEAWKRASLVNLGAGQALVKGGKRTPQYIFTAGNAPAALQPQSFRWEELPTPLRCDRFAGTELSDLPSALRPRRFTEDLHVFAIENAATVRFSPEEQAVEARLIDGDGGEATLRHHYHARGQSGVLRLHAELSSGGLRYVAGRARRTIRGLTIAPTALVFEREGRRSICQPWLDGDATDARLVVGDWTETEIDPFRKFHQDVESALSDLLLCGLERSDQEIRQRWRQLADRAVELGFQQYQRYLLALTDRAVAASAVLIALAFQALGPTWD